MAIIYDMTKKFWILVFLAIFVFGFIVGYLAMAFDIKNGILGGKETRTIWQILSPF